MRRTACICRNLATIRRKRCCPLRPRITIADIRQSRTIRRLLYRAGCPRCRAGTDAGVRSKVTDGIVEPGAAVATHALAVFVAAAITHTNTHSSFFVNSNNLRGRYRLQPRRRVIGLVGHSHAQFAATRQAAA